MPPEPLYGTVHRRPGLYRYEYMYLSTQTGRGPAADRRKATLNTGSGDAYYRYRVCYNHMHVQIGVEPGLVLMIWHARALEPTVRMLFVSPINLNE